MIVTTTESIEGQKIKEYFTPVFGTEIYLVGGVFGGGLANQENLFSVSYNTALKHLQNRVPARANAIVGLKIQLTPAANTGNMIILLTGTPVKIEAVEPEWNDSLPEI